VLRAYVYYCIKYGTLLSIVKACKKFISKSKMVVFIKFHSDMRWQLAVSYVKKACSRVVYCIIEVLSPTPQ
jgi:hypothetical protein